MMVPEFVFMAGYGWGLATMMGIWLITKIKL